ncbi:GNAT family N-acetyltransferase [Nocardia harenae]|uniref:GNAT family N-acetyltransferase n=1 Tax=Nocardia harenae TaxID=358707 RepID=UPI001FE0305F|nr:GNAT family N-acetyltransferase [Nocardia harenae]
MTIVPMAPEHAEAVTDCHVLCWREAHADVLPAHLLDALRTGRGAGRWRRVARDPLIETRVALAASGAVLGFASAGPARDIAAPTALELHALYVRAAEHGTGLADALLEGVVPAGTPCALWVLAANPRARAFYRRHGFRDDGARGLDPFALLPTLRMVRGALA